MTKYELKALRKLFSETKIEHIQRLAKQLEKNENLTEVYRKANNILYIVANNENIQTDDIVGKTRKQRVADARIIIGALIYNSTKLSLSQSGEVLNRDHATIMHYTKEVQKVTELYYKYNFYQQKLKL